MNTTGLESASPDPQNLADLLCASFRLHRGTITQEQWLELFCTVVNCSSAATVRWVRGSPEQSIKSIFGDEPRLPTDWKTWVDNTISASACRQVGFIESFAKSARGTDDLLKLHTIDSRILFGVVDWDPACVLLIPARSSNEPAWTEAEKTHVTQVLEYARESVLSHKALDQRRYISDLAMDILNSSPRGMIILSNDGVMQITNSCAERMLSMDDGVSRQNGRLVFDDKEAAKALADHLAILDTTSGSDAPEMDWNLAAKRPSGKTPYQLILGSIRLNQWNMESRASDRAAIVYIHDATNKTRPTNEQLRNFYGFTKAQARLAGALYAGENINEASRALNISINTARSHMRNIYAKTGVRTQSELLALLASGLTTYGKTKS